MKYILAVSLVLFSVPAYAVDIDAMIQQMQENTEREQEQQAERVQQEQMQEIIDDQESQRPVVVIIERDRE